MEKILIQYNNSSGKNINMVIAFDKILTLQPGVHNIEVLKKDLQKLQEMFDEQGIHFIPQKFRDDILNPGENSEQKINDIQNGVWNNPKNNKDKLNPKATLIDIFRTIKSKVNKF